jgi:hypothetical protein
MAIHVGHHKRSQHRSSKRPYFKKRKIDGQISIVTDIRVYRQSYFYKYSSVSRDKERINTESPAWVLIDSSILSLKVYHMNEEGQRPLVWNDRKCAGKPDTLWTNVYLRPPLINFLNDIATGAKYKKVYTDVV